MPLAQTRAPVLQTYAHASFYITSHMPKFTQLICATEHNFSERKIKCIHQYFGDQTFLRISPRVNSTVNVRYLKGRTVFLEKHAWAIEQKAGSQNLISQSIADKDHPTTLGGGVCRDEVLWLQKEEEGKEKKMGQIKCVMFGKLFGSKPSFSYCHRWNKCKMLSSVTVFSSLQKNISPHSCQNYYLGRKLRKEQ